MQIMRIDLALAYGGNVAHHCGMILPGGLVGHRFFGIDGTAPSTCCGPVNGTTMAGHLNSSRRT